MMGVFSKSTLRCIRLFCLFISVDPPFSCVIEAESGTEECDGPESPSELLGVRIVPGSVHVIDGCRGRIANRRGGDGGSGFVFEIAGGDDNGEEKKKEEPHREVGLVTGEVPEDTHNNRECDEREEECEYQRGFTDAVSAESED